MSQHEVEFWRELEPGKAMRVRVAVFEEGLPAPGEADIERAPTFSETLDLLLGTRIEQISLKKPF